MSESDTTDDGNDVSVVLLDYLPHGRSDDDRPRHKKSPVAYALGETNFHLYEIDLEQDADVNIGDHVLIEPRERREAVATVREIDYDELTSGARSELEYAVEELVEADERRFVDFYNDAQPITLRLHQLNLLPGIGKKLRNTILDERKRKPFESFEDLDDRVSGLHKPKEILVERIIEEIRDDDLKYRIFAR